MRTTSQDSFLLEVGVDLFELEDGTGAWLVEFVPSTSEGYLTEESTADRFFLENDTGIYVLETFIIPPDEGYLLETSTVDQLLLEDDTGSYLLDGDFVAAFSGWGLPI